MSFDALLTLGHHRCRQYLNRRASKTTYGQMCLYMFPAGAKAVDFYRPERKMTSQETQLIGLKGHRREDLYGHCRDKALA